MGTNQNDHPQTVHCGFCGNEIGWGYTACRDCGATVHYGLDADRGLWRFLAVAGAQIAVWGILIVAVIAFFSYRTRNQNRICIS